MELLHCVTSGFNRNNYKVPNAVGYYCYFIPLLPGVSGAVARYKYVQMFGKKPSQYVTMTVQGLDNKSQRLLGIELNIHVYFIP
jgi:hypothetical protein